MAVFRVERNTGYTVMSNHHLRNKELSLKAKGLLSQMLSLPEDWDYTLAGLSYINRESIDAIRTAVWELEKAGYITRRQGRDEKGKMTAIEYTIYEQPQPPELDCPVLENPTADNPTTENPTSENPMQLNKDISRTNLQKKEKSNTDLSSTHSIPIHLRCHSFYVGMVYLNDIPVDCHFPQVGFHVPGRDELHFLFNERPFFLCYSEFNLYCPFPAVHRLTLLSIPRVWDTSQQAIFNRRAAAQEGENTERVPLSYAC